VLKGHARLHGREGTVDIGTSQGVIRPGIEGAFAVLAPVRKQFVLVDMTGCYSISGLPRAPHGI